MFGSGWRQVKSTAGEIIALGAHFCSPPLFLGFMRASRRDIEKCGTKTGIVLRFVFRAALHKDKGISRDTDVNVLEKNETLMIRGKMDPVIDPELVVNKWKLRRMSPTGDHANYTPVLQIDIDHCHQTSHNEKWNKI